MAVVARCLTLLLCALAMLPAWAVCPDAAAVSAYLDDFVSLRASKGFGKDISYIDAVCARSALTSALPTVMGPAVGYKAVFTNPESQKRFGVAGPDWGVMYGRMMLTSGARVPAAFGALPRYEADFIVVVKDTGLADAKTPSEALAHISELVPFIELPDIMITGSPTGAELVATNAAFRGGVVGMPILVGSDSRLADALATMEVVITDDSTGQEIGRAKGSVLMDNPLNAAVWLARTLRDAGVVLKPGDMLSLGGFKGAAPTRAGSSITVRYLGLPGDPSVSVHFY